MRRFADLLALGGAAAIVYGCVLIWVPLGFLVGGGFGLLGAVVIAAAERETKPGRG